MKLNGNAFKIVVAIAMLALLISVPIAIYGGDTGTSSGTATVGNQVPNVSSSDIFDSGETASVNNTNLTPWANTYHMNWTVQDDNSLADLVNITIYIWEDTYADWDSADNAVNHFTFKYDEDGDSWSEVGPGPASEHLVAGSCSDPADHGATSGEFKLAFKLDPIANYTATKTWDANITAFDDSGASDSESIIVFGVNFRLELTVNDGSHAWSSLSPGSNDNLITSPGDNDIDVTITANAAFDLEAKGDGDLTSGGNTIGLGNVTIHADTLGSSASLTTGFLDIGGLTGLSSGESQAHSCQLWIDVPAGQPDGDYTYTLSIKGTQS